MKSPAVVDNDVISFQFKHDSRASLYTHHLSDRLLVVSFMTMAELDLWSFSRNWGERRRLEMEAYLGHYFHSLVGRETEQKWAAVMHAAKQNGNSIAGADAWNAATALMYDIPLITHNSNDYRGVPGLQIITAV